MQLGAYFALPEWGPSSNPVPAVPGSNAVDRLLRRLRPRRRSIALTARSYDEEGSLTTSIVEPHPQRPVLRRLVDILPDPTTAMAEPPPATALPATDPAAPIVAERVLRAVVERLRGRRAARQLSTILRPDVLAYLASLQDTAGPLQPRVRKVFAQQHAVDAVEAVAVVTLTTGVRALAARFERHSDRWQCTTLQLRLTAGDLAACGQLRAR
ncbi:MAG TPA: Rv3235 family protein [Pseudonocardiaceae bacterium]|nr:Rv3235 family protein [Pseudonocardiaceae bacterium]